MAIGLEEELTEKDIWNQSTQKAPLIYFKDGIFGIEGRSIQEYSREFYKEIINGTDKFEGLKNLIEQDKIKRMNVYLEYSNVSSSMSLLDIFKLLEKSKSLEQINWYCDEDDEEMLEAGENYSSEIKIPFKLIELVE